MYNCCTLNNTLIDIDMQSNDSMNSPIYTVLSTNENSLEMLQATVSPSVSSSSSYYSLSDCVHHSTLDDINEHEVNELYVLYV